MRKALRWVPQGYLDNLVAYTPSGLQSRWRMVGQYGKYIIIKHNKVNSHLLEL